MLKYEQISTNIIKICTKREEQQEEEEEEENIFK